MILEIPERMVLLHEVNRGIQDGCLLVIPNAKLLMCRDISTICMLELFFCFLYYSHCVVTVIGTGGIELEQFFGELAMESFSSDRLWPRSQRPP